MKSRQDLYVAFVGLLMTILCSLPLFVLRFFEDSEFVRDPNPAGYASIIFVSLGMFLGIIVIALFGNRQRAAASRLARRSQAACASWVSQACGGPLASISNT